MVTATALYAYYLLSLQLMATRFTYVGNKVLQVLLPPYLPTTTKTYTPLQEFSFFPSSLSFTFVPSHITPLPHGVPIARMLRELEPRRSPR